MGYFRCIHAVGSNMKAPEVPLVLLAGVLLGVAAVAGLLAEVAGAGSDGKRTT